MDSFSFRMRIRARAAGHARLQCRTEGQNQFPKTGQLHSFEVAGREWQEVSVPLPVKGRLVHLRLVRPNGRDLVEVDWMEVESQGDTAGQAQRWDF